MMVRFLKWLLLQPMFYMIFFVQHQCKVDGVAMCLLSVKKLLSTIGTYAKFSYGCQFFHFFWMSINIGRDLEDFGHVKRRVDGMDLHLWCNVPFLNVIRSGTNFFKVDRIWELLNEYKFQVWEPNQTSWKLWEEKRFEVILELNTNKSFMEIS